MKSVLVFAPWGAESAGDRGVLCNQAKVVHFTISSNIRTYKMLKWLDMKTTFDPWVKITNYTAFLYCNQKLNLST